MPESHKLRVFLCHDSRDKPIVRELYQRLSTESWIDPWLDEAKLYPGQDWDLEIDNAVETTDAVVFCVSNNSVTKEGYVQKEIRKILDKAEEKPEQTIFIIPLRLDETPTPLRVRKFQYIDYFPADDQNLAYERILQSLRIRRDQLFGQDNKSVTHQKANSLLTLEILFISLLVGTSFGLAALVVTLGLCPPLGALPAGFASSYWFLARRKDLPRVDGLRYGKYIGFLTGIPSIPIFIFAFNNIGTTSNKLSPDALVTSSFLLTFCFATPLSIGFGWLGGWLGSHYYASKWK